MKKKINIKSLFNKKENVVITGVALLFCVGLVLTKVNSSNIPLHDGDVLVDSQAVTQSEESEESSGKSEESSQKSGASDGTFDEKRAALDLERNDIIAKFDDTIENSSNKTEKKNAVAEKEKIIENMKKEVEIEGIISSKSLPESFVIITESSINVTVNEKELKQETVAKICNIVMEETSAPAEKIVIQSSY